MVVVGVPDDPRPHSPRSPHDDHDSDGELARPAGRAFLGGGARGAGQGGARGDPAQGARRLGRPRPGRPDPVDLLEEQAATRVPELVPIRYGRMLVSPFTFYRGAAYLMASDLAGTPRTGLHTQLCGDAHLSNFGAFAAPDRRLAFDINDFDETLPGPFEWDLKRLVASFAVAGRDLGFDARERRGGQPGRRAGPIARPCARFASMSDARSLVLAHRRGRDRQQCPAAASAKRRKRIDKNIAKARAKDSLRAFDKLTTMVDGEPRIASDPPLIVPIEELVGGAEAAEIEEFARGVHPLVPAHPDRRPPAPARALPLRRTPPARWSGSAASAPAPGSCSARPRRRRPALPAAQGGRGLGARAVPGQEQYANHGQRVVEGQRLMQAASDIMLGWQAVAGLDGVAARLLRPPALGPEGLGHRRGAWRRTS